MRLRFFFFFFFLCTRAGEGKQAEQQQPWHMAHIHSRLPRHRAPQRKSPFCFPRQGRREVSWVNRRLASPLHPPSGKKKKIKNKKGDRTSQACLLAVLPFTHFSTQTQAYQQKRYSCCDRVLPQLNWVSLHCCNNNHAVSAGWWILLEHQFMNSTG